MTFPLSNTFEALGCLFDEIAAHRGIDMRDRLRCCQLGFTPGGRGPFLFRNQYQRVNRHSSLLLLIFVIGAVPVGAIAQGNDDFLKRKTHEFEQCANVCQADLDKKLFQCMPYREDQEKPAPENCLEDARQQFDACMALCPLDPRPG